MPKPASVHIENNASRRAVFAGTMAAMAALALPRGASAKTNDDALLASCQRFDSLADMRWHADEFVDNYTDDEALLLMREYADEAGILASMPAMTAAGRAAKVQAVLTYIAEDDGSDYLVRRLAEGLLEDFRRAAA